MGRAGVRGEFYRHSAGSAGGSGLLQLTVATQHCGGDVPAGAVRSGRRSLAALTRCSSARRTVVAGASRSKPIRSSETATRGWRLRKVSNEFLEPAAWRPASSKLVRPRRRRRDRRPPWTAAAGDEEWRQRSHAASHESRSAAECEAPGAEGRTGRGTRRESKVSGRHRGGVGVPPAVGAAAIVVGSLAELSLGSTCASGDHRGVGHR
jgi:hypothetical protein